MKKISPFEKRTESLHIRYPRRSRARGHGTKTFPEVGKFTGSTIADLQKHITQLNRSLKRFPRQPAPEDVHRLRRQIRTLEAIVDALTGGRKRQARHLLKALVLIGKTAGKVRDMDVLVALACSLSDNPSDECRVQLLEYLGDRRFKTAAKLDTIIHAHRAKALHSLERCSRLIDEKNFSTNTAALAQSLATEISNCRRLNKDSLHEYRLKVKELRSLLQLFTKSDTKFIAALGKAKDAIGEWHDWNELADIARRAGGPGRTYGVQKQVQLIAREKLRRAIVAANQIQQKGLR